MGHKPLIARHDHQPISDIVSKGQPLRMRVPSDKLAEVAAAFLDVLCDFRHHTACQRLLALDPSSRAGTAAILPASAILGSCWAIELA